MRMAGQRLVQGVANSIVPALNTVTSRIACHQAAFATLLPQERTVSECI